MTPVACPFPDCGRYAGHPGRCVPPGLIPPPRNPGGPTGSEVRVNVAADECLLRRDGSCGRGDHPTPRSTCNQEHHRA